MTKVIFVTDKKNAKWKDLISFSQADDAMLVQKLKCLEDFEIINMSFNELILAKLRYKTFQ